jgi:SAM-dependent methyltransferase
MPDSLALTPLDFLDAFGAPEEDAGLIRAEVAKHDFRYRRLPQDERDALVLSILKKLDGFTQVGEHRHGIWETAWSDVANRYDCSGGDLSSLEPSFIGGTGYIRLQGDYAWPLAPKFEFSYFRVFRLWLFCKYLADARRVCEFGCGSGFNLAALAQIAPDKQLVGLDWAAPAVDLINRFSQKHGFNLTGRSFDFFNPDPSFELGPGSVAMTFCALEQTGERCVTFIDWLMEKKPDLVISMEPVLDFYDPGSLCDDMAIRYHTHRQYLQGYLGRVRELEAQGRVEIVQARRLGMGSLYHEGYSLLIWKPLP